MELTLKDSVLAALTANFMQVVSMPMLYILVLKVLRKLVYKANIRVYTDCFQCPHFFKGALFTGNIYCREDVSFMSYTYTHTHTATQYCQDSDIHNTCLGHVQCKPCMIT